jgi:hypothetical protein
VGGDKVAARGKHFPLTIPFYDLIVLTVTEV